MCEKNLLNLIILPSFCYPEDVLKHRRFAELGSGMDKLKIYNNLKGSGDSLDKGLSRSKRVHFHCQNFLRIFCSYRVFCAWSFFVPLIFKFAPQFKVYLPKHVMYATMRMKNNNVCVSLERWCRCVNICQESKSC